MSAFSPRLPHTKDVKRPLHHDPEPYETLTLNCQGPNPKLLNPTKPYRTLCNRKQPYKAVCNPVKR